jgi:chromate transporter
VALFRFKVGVMPLLGACAAVGLVATLFFPGLR